MIEDLILGLFRRKTNKFWHAIAILVKDICIEGFLKDQKTQQQDNKGHRKTNKTLKSNKKLNCLHLIRGQFRVRGERFETNL